MLFHLSSESLLISCCGSLSASLCMVSLCFLCSVHSSYLSFRQECLLAGLLSNCSIALFILSWNSLMNSSQSALRLTSDKLSLSLVSSWSLVWSWGGSSVASCCHTFLVWLLDSPVTSHLSGDRHHGTCSCVFGGVSSTRHGACSHVLGGVSSTLISSITVPVTFQRLCVPDVSPVGCLTVLASLPNVVTFPVSCLTVPADEHGCQSQHVSNSNSTSVKHLSLLPSPTASSQPTLPHSIHHLLSIIHHQWQLPISSLLNYRLDFPNIQ